MVFYYFPLNQTLRVVAKDFKDALIYYLYLKSSPEPGTKEQWD